MAPLTTSKHRWTPTGQAGGKRKLDRLNEAVTEWSSSTDFDPFREYGSGPNKVIVDGSEDPNCPLDSNAAVTCTYYQPRTNQAGAPRYRVRQHSDQPDHWFIHMVVRI